MRSLMCSAGVIAVTCWLGGHTAIAQPKPDPATLKQAKDYFEAGKDAYVSGQYKIAVTAFQEAYRLVPRPPILFSTAQAYRRQYVLDSDPHNVEQALKLYKQYLREVEKGGRRNDAVQHIATLEPIWDRIKATQTTDPAPVAPARQPTQLMVTSRIKGARASIDGGELTEVPLTLEVPPGTHKVHVEAPGYFTDETEGIAVEGRLIVVPVELRPMPARVTFRTPSGGRITVDGRRLRAGEMELAAGKHFVAVTRRGHVPFARELIVERGQELTVTAPLRTTKLRKASYFVLGGAAVTLLAGGVTTGLTLWVQGEAQDILDKRDVDRRNLTSDEIIRYNDLIGQRNDLRTISYIVLGTAGVVAVTGGLLYWFDNPQAEAPYTGIRVTPTVGGDSVGAALTARFD